MNGETMLSKWWKTESCRQAFERVEKARTERIEKLKISLREKQEKLVRDVEEWQLKS